MRTTLLLAFVAVPLISAGETLGPSALAKNEVVTIECVHDECRSGYRRVYEISGGDAPVMTISEYYHYGYGEDTRDKTPAAKETLGRLALEKKDAVGLDRLLEFYRLKIPGDSTTTDRISVVYLRDGKKIGDEEFFDQSGVATVAEDFRQEGDEFLRENSRGVDIELMKALAPLYRFNKYLWKKEANLEGSAAPERAAGPRLDGK